MTDPPDGLLAEWCATLTKNSEMPAAAWLPTGIAVVSAIVGPRLYIKWTPTRRERCNLWLLVVGRSALARKTTGMSAAKWAVQQAGMTLGDQIRWYSAKRLSDAQLAMDLDVLSADRERAQRDEDTIAGAENRKPRQVEVQPRSVPVAWLLGANELSPLWGESIAEWKAATQGFLLDAFDGEIVSRTRQSKVPEQETFISAIGNIPPDVLQDKTTLNTLVSGFAGRWLLMRVPGAKEPVPIPSINGSDPLAGLAPMISLLAELASGCEGIDAVALWSKGAISERDGWYRRYWHRYSGADPTVEIRARSDLFGRAQAHALKLATLAAVCRQVAAISRLEDVRVEACDVEWAQAVCDESMEAMAGVLEESGGGSSTLIGRAENRVLRALDRLGAFHEETAVALREVSHRARGSGTHQDIVRAIESLASVGMVEWREISAGPKGGRPGRKIWLMED